MRISDWNIPTQNALTSSSVKDVSDVVKDYKRMEDELQSIYGYVTDVGRVVDYLAFVLRLVQPNNSNKMFDVRWWVSHGRRVPTLVRWMRKEGAVVFARPVKRIEKEMIEAAAVPEMRPLLEEILRIWFDAQGLWFLLRKKLYSEFRPGDMGRMKVERRLQELVVRIARIHMEALDVLVVRGVIVETQMGLDEVITGRYGS